MDQREKEDSIQEREQQTFSAAEESEELMACPEEEDWGVPQLNATIQEVSTKIAQTASFFTRQLTSFLVTDQAVNNASNGGVSEERAVISADIASTSGSSRLPLDGISSNSSTSILTALSQSFLTSPPAAWQGLLARVQTTLRGSADDIGWLSKEPNLPEVDDGTPRFLQLFNCIREGVHVLPDSLVYLLIPGLFSNHGPLYFVDTKKYFSRLGLTCSIARIHSEAAVETNALELKQYIEELYWGTGKRIMLLGHSKGGVDAAAAASMFWPDIKDKVVGLVLVQSPYGGSPIASDILREGQIADVETRRIMEVLICKVIKGDMRALEDLTYEKRRQFLAKYPLPLDFPIVCFHTEAGRSPGVLSTLSQIAHAELPWLPISGSGTVSGVDAPVAKLPVVVPLAAAMAACALHLELRYAEKSDGLVARKDAEVPGSVVVRLDKKLDHAWMVYSSDPDAFYMCEALMTMLLEISERRSRLKGDINNGINKNLLS